MISAASYITLVINKWMSMECCRCNDIASIQIGSAWKMNLPYCDFYPPQTPHELALDWNQASMVKGWWLTTWAMAQLLRCLKKCMWFFTKSVQFQPKLEHVENFSETPTIKFHLRKAIIKLLHVDRWTDRHGVANGHNFVTFHSACWEEDKRSWPNTLPLSPTMSL